MDGTFKRKDKMDITYVEERWKVTWPVALIPPILKPPSLDISVLARKDAMGYPALKRVYVNCELKSGEIKATRVRRVRRKG